MAVCRSWTVPRVGALVVDVALTETVVYCTDWHPSSALGVGTQIMPSHGTQSVRAGVGTRPLHHAVSGGVSLVGAPFFVCMDWHPPYWPFCVLGSCSARGGLSGVITPGDYPVWSHHHAFRGSSLGVRGLAARDGSQEIWCGFTHVVSCPIVGRAAQAVIHCFSLAVVATVFVLSWTPALSFLFTASPRFALVLSTVVLSSVGALVVCSASRAAGQSPFSSLCFFPLGPAWPDCPTHLLHSLLSSCSRVDCLHCSLAAC